MQFFILVLLICLFVFLYCVYLLAHDDFIFLRRDVTMERIFNIVFLGSLCSLFFARLFYGLFTVHQSGAGFTAKNILENPFVFLLFPYFPGLSMLGGVLGAGVFLGFLATRKNLLPLGRLVDFFSIAFLITLPIGFLGYFMFSEESFSAIRAGSLVVAYLMLFAVFLRFLLPQLLNGNLKEGTISFLFLISFSITSLIEKFVSRVGKAFTFTIEDFILIIMLLVSLAFLIKHEKLMERVRKFRRKEN